MNTTRPGSMPSSAAVLSRFWRTAAGSSPTPPPRLRVSHGGAPPPPDREGPATRTRAASGVDRTPWGVRLMQPDRPAPRGGGERPAGAASAGKERNEPQSGLFQLRDDGTQRAQVFPPVPAA